MVATYVTTCACAGQRYVARMLVSIGLLLCAGISQAQTCGIDGAGQTCKAGAGNPINTMTGNKYQQEVDLPALPGVLGLEIIRHYNSDLSKPNDAPGIVGRGWKLSYETELSANGRTIDIRDADGTLHTFICDALNVQHCDSEDHTQGSVRRQRTGSSNVASAADAAHATSNDYLWTWNDGRVLRFNQRGKLVQIEAPTGEFVVLQYDARQLLIAVTDPQGRQLQLHYPERATGRTAGTSNLTDTYHGVDWIDSPVGRFAYRYGSNLPKAATLAKGFLLANLVKVEGPVLASSKTTAATSGRANSSRIYHYEDALHPTYLTGISFVGTKSDSSTNTAAKKATNSKTTEQRYATFGYNADGKAILSTHADNIDKATLDYRGPGQTIVTNSLGQTTVYKYAVLAGHYRLLEIRGAGCALCSTPNRRYGYDALGRLNIQTTLTAEGQPIQTIRTDLDYYGRPLAVYRIDYRDGTAQPAQWQVRYAYGEDTGSMPILIAKPSVVPGQELTTKISYNKFAQPLAVTQNGWAPAADGKGQATAIERTTRYAYSMINGRSLLTQIDGALANGPNNSPTDSDITRFDWDAQGTKVIAATTPGNFKSQFTYDPAGRLVGVANNASERTTMTYDGANRLSAITQNGVTQRYQYDAMGRQVEVGIDAGDGYRALTHVGFDAANRPIWSASHLGILTTRRYDTENNLLGISTDSSRFKQAQTFDYDTTGRLVASTDAQGGTRTLHWNAQGLPDAITDALGRTQNLRYDGLGRLDQVTNAANSFTAKNTASAAQSAPTATHFERDAHGNTITVIAPNGAITRTVNDDFGQVIAIDSADAGLVTRSYDVAGRLIASTDANGNAASYTYDAADRIVRQSVTDAHATDPRNRQTVTVWSYAGKRLVAIDHPNQSERYAYDAQGNDRGCDHHQRTALDEEQRW